MNNPFAKAGNKLAAAAGRVKAMGQQDMAPPPRRIPPPTDAMNKALTVNQMLPKGATSRPKRRVVTHDMLASIARTDPVTAGLIYTVKSLVSMTPWDIVPDIMAEAEEMNRWEDQSCDCINEWGYRVPFTSSVLPGQTVSQMTAEIDKILAKPLSKTDAIGDTRKRRAQIQTLFRLKLREMEQDAMVNATVVRRLYQRPNVHWEKSLTALHKLLLSDLLIDDTACIVKNWNFGDELAELYRIPGYEVTPLSYPDYTVPQPPLPAYVWATSSKVMGWFTNAQLVNLIDNPQGDGNGLSPMEVLMYIATASIMGDNALARNLKEGFLPPGLLNLKGATSSQRDAFAADLYGQISKSAGNRIVVLNDVPSEDGTFQWQELAKGHDFQKMQLMQYLQLGAAEKAFVFGFKSEDVGIVAATGSGQLDPAQAAMALYNRPGVTGRLDLLEAYHNGEIVKQEFGFTNVRFAFDRKGGLINDVLEDAQADSVLTAAGVFSINEVRKRRKQRPVAGGDILTKATGNALIQVDALQFAESADGFLMPQMGGAQNGAVSGGAGPNGANPSGGDGGVKPRKRNNANARLQSKGTESRAVKKALGGGENDEAEE